MRIVLQHGHIYNGAVFQPFRMRIGKDFSCRDAQLLHDGRVAPALCFGITDILKDAPVVLGADVVTAQCADALDDGCVVERFVIQRVAEVVHDGFHLAVGGTVAAADQIVDGDREDACQCGEKFHVRIGRTVLPAADGLEGNTELFGKCFLCHVVFPTQTSDVFTDVQFHVLFPFKIDRCGRLRSPLFSR